MRSERDGDRSLGSHSRHPETSPKPGPTPKSPPPGAQPALWSFTRVFLVSQHLKGVIFCWSIHPALGEGSGNQRLVVPKCISGFRNSKTQARSLLLVFAVTQYGPDVRAIWEETIKASGNGY